MANRYDRDPDDYGFGRREGREPSRDDEHRQGQSAQGHRPGERQSPWRAERDRSEEYNPGRWDQDHRGRDNTWRGADNNAWRGANQSGNDYYAGREGSGRSDYHSSGRDYSSYNDRDRGQYGNYERGQLGGSGRERDDYRNDPQRHDRGDYRGIYQEQVWTRDPRSGNVYGYEYSTRVNPRRFNAGDESADRWRTNVNDQNQRFDIDRGWHTPGSNAGGYGDTRTSGYGNAGNFKNSNYGSSNYGKGPKGYTRSDERIREDVCDRLSDDDEIDARDITVTVKNAEVILEGTVNDRRSKHRAEDVAESVSGVKDVTNHLRARKGLLQELGDKISGDDDAEHHGHRGSGTRNSPAGNLPQKTAH